MILLNGNYSVVRREELRTFFEGSPSAKLLRSDSAPYVLEFLQESFKSGNAISLGQSELRARLTSYLEELHETEPEVMVGPAERYIAQWAEAGWLKRFVEANSTEPQYQLTAHAEEAIQFVDSAIAKRQTLVGTESRLRLIIETLDAIVRGATADPQRRLDYLREEQRKLEEEIKATEGGKAIQVLRPPQLRERFQTAMNLLKELQSDFRAVEERFQIIARDVHKLRVTGSESRGTILGFALDSEDLLKQQDEGVSFFAFVRFLLSPAQQQALRKNIEEIHRLEALADQQDSLARLRKMISALLAEADKVMRTTQRLSATLRRLLDAQSTEHRVRLANVLRDIRAAALELRSNPPSGTIIEIDTQAEIGSPLTRPFWTPDSEFGSTQLVAHESDPSNWMQLAATLAKMHRLDYRKLRNQIHEFTLDGPKSLSDLSAAHPISSVIDVLGYLQIASDDGHQIDLTQSELIRLRRAQDSPTLLQLTVPRVLYLPHASRRTTTRKAK